MGLGKPPKEDVMARTMIGLSGELAVDRFVFYSVLHPLLANVPPTTPRFIRLSVRLLPRSPRLRVRIPDQP